MGKINSMMDIGKRSMMNSQSNLHTVSHNIASKNVEGFTRQRVEQVTNQPIVEGNLQFGMGAKAAKITRVNNPFVDNQLAVESGALSFHDSQAESLNRVQEVFNEQMNKGLNTYISSFYNAYRELANNPESTTTRTMVKEAAEALAKDFTRVQTQLEGVQEGIDGKIISQIQQINGYTKEIGDLNRQIATTEAQGVHANDQRDRRDLLVKKLNEIIDVKVAEGDKGMITIQSAGNAILVSGFDSMTLTHSFDPQTARLQIYYKPEGSYPPLNITTRILAGSIGGNLQIRVIEDFKSQVDTLAASFAGEVNKIHFQGYDRFGKQAGLFFEPLTQTVGAAKNLKVSDDIRKDVGRIATGAQPNAPGDNTVANMISQLQHRQIMDGGTSTFDDFYKAQVGRVGVIANKAVQTHAAQENIVKQVNNLRESISGVSLDEEAAKMIEFQKTFDASARLIRTADEMLETVINLKRI